MHVPKLVLAVAPHTSSLDFPVGVLVKCAMHLPANYVGKHTLFRPPFGFIFRALGGVPVDRTRRGHFVSSTAEAFRQNPHLHLVIAPEGTRKKVEKFRTGFYHIARLAEVPVYLCSFNWATKTVHFEPKPFPITGNEQQDLEAIWQYFKDIPGRNREKGIL